MDRSGKQVGKYYGPPATWENMAGSKVTATQVAVAPAAADSIPLQLVKANPATGSGMMTGVTYIQRVATQGGVAPASACDAPSMEARQVVNTRPTTSSIAPADRKTLPSGSSCGRCPTAGNASASSTTGQSPRLL